jgi:hypothetical protein
MLGRQAGWPGSGGALRSAPVHSRTDDIDLKWKSLRTADVGNDYVHHCHRDVAAVISGIYVLFRR